MSKIGDWHRSLTPDDKIDLNYFIIGVVFAIVGVLLGWFVSSELWKRELHHRGHGEFYINDNCQRSWRWRETDDRHPTLIATATNDDH